MSALNYIKIVGLDGEPGEEPTEWFEMFQGIGGASLTNASVTGGGGTISTPSVTPSVTPISTDEELDEALWEGQNARIQGEIGWLNQIQTDIKKKQAEVQNQKSRLFDMVKGILTNTVGEAVDALLLSTLGPYSEIAGFVASLSVGWALDKLQVLLQRGNDLIPGMITEYEHLLEVESSRDNYELREQVIARHREDIRLILDSITEIEGQIADTVNMDTEEIVKALQDLLYKQENYWLPGGVRVTHQGALKKP